MKFQRIQDLRVDSDLSQRQLGEFCISVSVPILIMKQAHVAFRLKCSSALLTIMTQRLIIL